jgi:F-type H+-transporting ATPase subunit b
MNITATLFAQAAVFALFIAFTVKFIWPYMLRAIETRQKTIADGLAAAEQGQRSLEESTRQAEDSLAQARDRAAEIIAQAEKRAAQLIDEARNAAKEEGSRENGRGQGRDRAGAHARARAAARPRGLARRRGAEKILRARSTRKRTPSFWTQSRNNFEKAMAEPSTVARPYAEAASSSPTPTAPRANGPRCCARSRWWPPTSGAPGDFRPQPLRAQVAGMFIAILSGRLDGAAENFVRVLPTTAASSCWPRSTPSSRR